MTAIHTLQHALRSFLVLRKRHTEPAWARLAAGAVLVLAVALVLMTVSVFLMAVPRLDWWRSALWANLLLGLGAGATMLLMLRACELLLPARAIDALAAMDDWRPLALVSAILVAGMALGIRLIYITMGFGVHIDLWTKLSRVPLVQLKFLMFVLLVVAANWLWWQFRAKDTALARQAAESQLRMLQAQIEPHFLFNTLANVQSLIRSDPQRAQLMLESFTDYLRASLCQMRDSDITLAVELDTAHSYLQLMQIRMGRRLRFSIDACEEARRAVLPPLLLQPLVENAVHHGLEDKVGGGSIALHARVVDGRLEVRVDDDGLGLDRAPGSSRPDSGMALANIRARLHTRYGSGASLHLTALDNGTRAALAIPFSAPAAA